jgi:hypothetical protein
MWSGYINSQNNILQSLKILILFMKCNWMMEKLGISVQSIIGPMFFHETVNSKHYMRLILSADLWRKIVWAYFTQDNAKTQTTNSSMSAVDTIFDEVVISHWVWSPWSFNLNHFISFVGHTKRKSLYEQSTLFGRTLENVNNEISAISIKLL